MRGTVLLMREICQRGLFLMFFFECIGLFYRSFSICTGLFSHQTPWSRWSSRWCPWFNAGTWQFVSKQTRILEQAHWKWKLRYVLEVPRLIRRLVNKDAGTWQFVFIHKSFIDLFSLSLVFFVATKETCTYEKRECRRSRRKLHIYVVLHDIFLFICIERSICMYPRLFANICHTWRLFSSGRWRCECHYVYLGWLPSHHAQLVYDSYIYQTQLIYIRLNSWQNRYVNKHVNRIGMYIYIYIYIYIYVIYNIPDINIYIRLNSWQNRSFFMRICLFFHICSTW